MAVQVRDSPERSRFELLVDDEVVGVADYEVRGDVVVMPHTHVDPAHRGRGLAERLVGEALAEVRSSGRSVVPTCWYVSRHIERHPELGDLLAD